MNFSELPQHHAVLLVSEARSASAKKLWEELQGISLAHRFFDQTVLDIDTARDIISWANTPYNDEKVGLISFHTAGIPAQNAMLKILEEPRAGVRFVLVTSNKESLLPTVISRLHVISLEESKRKNGNVAEFLETKPTSRMKLPCIADLLAREDEEGRKDRESARVFLLSLGEHFVGAKGISKKHAEEIFECASYASDPSTSIKAIFEYLSLLLPQVKN